MVASAESLQFHASLNISPKGVPFRATSNSLVIKWKDRIVNSEPIANNQPKLGIRTFTEIRPAAKYGKVTAHVDKDYTLIGGGCRSDSIGAGQLLTGSFPESNGWSCEAQDHSVEDSSPLTAFALGIPTRTGVKVQVDTALSDPPERLDLL